MYWRVCKCEFKIKLTTYGTDDETFSVACAQRQRKAVGSAGCSFNKACAVAGDVWAEDTENGMRENKWFIVIWLFYDCQIWYVPAIFIKSIHNIWINMVS